MINLQIGDRDIDGRGDQIGVFSKLSIPPRSLPVVKGISQKTQQKRGSDRDSTNGPKRTADEVLRDRADIARMRLEGLTQTKIAEEISRLRDYALSERTIRDDLKAVREEWLGQSIDNYDRTRLIELSRLDEEEAIAIGAWVRSTLPSKKEKTRTGTTDGKPFEEFMQESVNRDGNPAFLQRLESIRQRRCAILGFNAQQRSENINVAIETLLAAGYIVRLPEDGSG